MTVRPLHWLFIASFALIVLGLGSAFFKPIQTVFRSALTSQPETFTELYFDEHLKLPKKIPHDTMTNFTFTIHNLEGKTITYPIEIYTQNQGDPPLVVPLLQTERTLADGESRTLSVEFMIPQSFGSRGKVTVSLKNIDQSIHFWVELPVLPSPSPSPPPRSIR